MTTAVLDFQLAVQADSKTITTRSSSGSAVREKRQQLDAFLASVERRALRTAEFAVRNRDDALEIVQDAMLKLVQNYAEDSAEEWPPLFHRILHSRIMDHHRRGKVVKRLFAWFQKEDEDGEVYDPIENAEASGIQNPLERLDLEQGNEALVAAVAELPERQRQAFLLRYWEGQSEKQMAFIMQCSEGSVKTHLSRALANLRQRLQEYQP